MNHTKNVYFFENTLPSNLNGCGEAHWGDFWPKYGQSSALFHLHKPPLRLASETQWWWEFFIHPKRIKYIVLPKIDKSLGEGILIIFYLIIQKLQMKLCGIFYALEMSLARGILTFWALFGDKKGYLDLQINLERPSFTCKN